MFENKVAVVTGAGGTLCSEIAINLAKEGAKVVLVGRTEEKLTKVYEKIVADGGNALVYPCDVTDKDAIAKLAERVESTFGLNDARNFALAACLIVLGNDICTFNNNLALFGRSCNYLSSYALILAGDNNDEIVFLNMKIFHLGLPP